MAKACRNALAEIHRQSGRLDNDARLSAYCAAALHVSDTRVVAFISGGCEFTGPLLLSGIAANRGDALPAGVRHRRVYRQFDNRSETDWRRLFRSRYLPQQI